MLKRLLPSVKRTKVLASTEIRGLEVLCTERIPSTWAEHTRIFEIVHVDRDAKNRSQCDEQVTNMARSHHAVVGTPVVHDFVGRSKRAFAGHDRREPSRGPSRIGAVIQNVVNRICLLYTSPSPRDQRGSRMPSSA